VDRKHTLDFDPEVVTLNKEFSGPRVIEQDMLGKSEEFAKPAKQTRRFSLREGDRTVSLDFGD